MALYHLSVKQIKRSAGQSAVAAVAYRAGENLHSDYSVWDKKQHETPKDQKAIFPGTHERIIEDDVFEKVQLIRQQRHRKTKSGRSSMFSGLPFCSDCGKKLYYGATNNYKPECVFFDCSFTGSAKISALHTISGSPFWSVWS